MLTKAASQAPVPEDGNITIGPWVLKIGLSWLRISRVNSGKFGPLWSMTASDIALRTLSGTFDGPGIWRKCLPAGWITLLIFTFLFFLKSNQPVGNACSAESASIICALADCFDT